MEPTAMPPEPGPNGGAGAPGGGTSPRGRKWILLVPALLLLALGVACWGPWGHAHPPLGPLTRLEIHDRTGETLRVLEDPDEVRRIGEFIDAHSRGWGGMNDWAGVPVPRLNAVLYDGTTLKGSLGVGPRLLVCQRAGDFQSKSISKAEEERFLDLIGCPDYEPRK